MGLPVGVKFDPTDQELIEHLETKVMDGGSRAHPLIDDFIPTIQGEDGICYTHPEKLPGEIGRHHAYLMTLKPCRCTVTCINPSVTSIVIVVTAVIYLRHGWVLFFNGLRSATGCCLNL